MPTMRASHAAAGARCFGQAGTCVYAIDGSLGESNTLNINEALKP
jgi:hypothetical protein